MQSILFECRFFMSSELVSCGHSCLVLCCPHALPLLSLPDVNECEMSLALCGGFPCENVDGSFLCICTNDNEEFDPVTNQCRPRGNRTGLELTGTHGSSFYFPIIQGRGFPLNK